MKQLYGFAVVKCNVDPEYFLYEMGSYEVEALSEAYLEEYKDGWEKTRTIAHAVISSQSTKPVKASDIMPFSWDKEGHSNKAKTASDDIERIKNKFKM